MWSLIYSEKHCAYRYIHDIYSNFKTDSIFSLFFSFRPIVKKSYNNLKVHFQSTVPLPDKDRSPMRSNVNYTTKSVEELLELFLQHGVALHGRYTDIAR